MEQIRTLCSAQAAANTSDLNDEQADALAFLIHADALRLAAQYVPGTALRLRSDLGCCACVYPVLPLQWSKVNPE